MLTLSRHPTSNSDVAFTKAAAKPVSLADTVGAKYKAAQTPEAQAARAESLIRQAEAEVATLDRKIAGATDRIGTIRSELHSTYPLPEAPFSDSFSFELGGDTDADSWRSDWIRQRYRQHWGITPPKWLFDRINKTNCGDRVCMSYASVENMIVNEAWAQSTPDMVAASTDKTRPQADELLTLLTVLASDQILRNEKAQFLRDSAAGFKGGDLETAARNRLNERGSYGAGSSGEWGGEWGTGGGSGGGSANAPVGGLDTKTLVLLGAALFLLLRNR